MKQVITNRRLVMVLLCLFVVLISVSSASAASTVYVNATGGNDSNNGTIDHPYQTIGQGINSVDENGTVTIADGTYSGTGNTNLTITKNMNITGQSQKGTIIDGTNTNWIFKINNGVTVNIQNLTLTNGNTTSDGGAIYNQGTINSLSGCTFTGNTANGSGGAIYNQGTINSLSGCTFTGNIATYGAGGAIYNQGTITSVSGCTFTGNRATYAGGAIYNQRNINSVSGCTFNSNTATTFGGAICNQGTINSLSGCTFTGNTATNGGAINNFAVINSVSGCTFTGNTATNGGAINNDFGYRMHAQYNWWGSNKGPSYDQISGETIFGPWLCMNITVDSGNIAYGSNGTVTVSFNKASDGKGIPDGVHIPDGTIVNFSSSLGTFNPTQAVTKDGIATTTFTATNISTGDVYAKTDDQTVFKTITVNKAATTLIVDDVTGVNGQKVNLTATLTDQNGKKLAGQTVTFHINGTDYTATTDKNGIATYEYTITQKMGTYPITANFNNGTVYTNSTGTGNLTVSLINTTLTVDNITSVNGQKVNLTATLTDQNGKKLAGQTITFHINGTDYTATTKDDGVATLSYKPLKAGFCIVNASFVDGMIYANSTGTGNLTVNPAANLYIDTTTNNKNPTIGQTFILTYKLGNYGPDAADNVTVTFQLPEGLDFVDIKVDNGKYSYDPTTRTITWTLNSVPIGDPYLYLTVKAVGDGTYTIKPNITSTTYNLNTGNNGNITINIQPNNNNNNNSNNGSSTNTVHAATQTIAMQHTGIPLTGLALAILAIFSGILPKRKQ